MNYLRSEWVREMLLMEDVIVTGGGVYRLVTAMLVARDGHEVRSWLIR